MRGWAPINLMLDGGWIAMLAFVAVVLVFYWPRIAIWDCASLVQALKHYLLCLASIWLRPLYQCGEGGEASQSSADLSSIALLALPKAAQKLAVHVFLGDLRHMGQGCRGSPLLLRQLP